MAENENLHARISALAGRINRRKHQSSSQSYGVPYPPTRSYGSQASHRPPTRFRPSFRNHSLVTHGLNKTASDEESPIHSNALQDFPNGLTKTEGSTLKWYRPEVLEKQNLARAEAQKLKAKAFQDRERAKVRHFAESSLEANVQAPSSSKVHTITIEGIPFTFNKTYNKLLRPSGISAPAGATPKGFVISGVNFKRTKNGNLVRANAVEKRVGQRKKTELCKRFTSTGINHPLYNRSESSPGVPYTVEGFCPKGDRCSGIHDGDKTAICPTFLRKGECSAGGGCDHSHVLSPERTPSCSHFLRGRCTNELCRYSHSQVSPTAPICRSFAVLGFCSGGTDCSERHLRECPDYANEGHCRSKHCSLPHVDHAGQMRQISAPNTVNSANQHVDDDDISSEGENYDEIDSDDADSDDVFEPEAVFGSESALDIAKQDFIKLS